MTFLEKTLPRSMHKHILCPIIWTTCVVLFTLSGFRMSVLGAPYAIDITDDILLTDFIENNETPEISEPEINEPEINEPELNERFLFDVLNNLYVSVENLESGNVYCDSVSFTLTGGGSKDLYVRYRCEMLTSAGERRTVEDSTITAHNIFERTISYSMEGAYNILYYVYDEYGNASEKKDITFVIDCTSPEIFFEGIDVTQPLKSGTDMIVGVRELFFEGMSVYVRIFRHDGNLITEVPVSAFEYKAVTSRNIYTFAGSGTYSVCVTARDRAGHEVEKSISFSIDESAPLIDILFDDKCPENGEILNTIPSLNISVSETNYNGGMIFTTLYRKLGKEIFENISTPVIKMTGEKTICPIQLSEEGEYELRVEAVDAIGNKSSEMLHFVIDMYAPEIGYFDDFNEKYLKSFELPENMRQYMSDMTGISYMTYLNAEETAPGKIKKDGKYILQVVAWDEAGNSSEEMIAFIVDNTNPTIIISGLNENGNMDKDMPVTVSLKDESDYLTGVYINGDKINIASDKKSAELIPTEYGDYRIYVSARDNAGNLTTETINTRCEAVLAAPISSINKNITVKTLEKKDDNTGYKMPSPVVLWLLCGIVCIFTVTLIIIAFSYEISYTK